MPLQELAVISIHPDPERPLELDLKHILSALGERLEDWVWCIRDLDCLGQGQDAEAFSRAVEDAGSPGLWINSEDFLRRSRGIYQTIEGSFLAFPGSLDRRSLDGDELCLGLFPTSKAEFAIVAVDGCYFDIYSKDPAATHELLERFATARPEPADHYF